ncbi:hypothetical protein Hanom_Chr16g01499981 [Helianthus anomalus]
MYLCGFQEHVLIAHSYYHSIYFSFQFFMLLPEYISMDHMKRLRDDMFSNPQIKQPFGSLCGDWRIWLFCLIVCEFEFC